MGWVLRTAGGRGGGKGVFEKESFFVATVVFSWVWLFLGEWVGGCGIESALN